jgi:hypothetical protein
VVEGLLRTSAARESHRRFMDVFIYTYGRMPCGLDEIEDALESVLGDRGEVTGTGTGQAGSNFDLFIKDDTISEEQALLLVRQALADFELPGGTSVIIDGSRYPLA